MNRSIVLAVLAIASFHLSPLVAGTPTRFVNGTDGTCGGNSPCHGSIQDAVEAAADGEVIEVQTSSEYQENVLVIEKDSLTIQNRPGDDPRISPSTGHGLELRASTNFTLDGVNIDLGGKIGALDALVIPLLGEPLDGLVVKNVLIRGIKDCVDFEASIDGVTFDNVEILNATDDMGFEVNAAEFGGTIQNLTVTNSRFRANIKHLWLSGDVRNIVIENNFFDRTVSGEAIIIDDLAPTAGPIDITNNVIIDSQQQGLLVRSGTNSNVNVVGNTIVNRSTFNGNVDDNVGVTFRDDGSANVIRDNIVVANGFAAGYAKSDSQGVTFDHNLQFDTGSGTESSGESPIPLDATSIEANPVFMDDSTLADDFRLGCASPAIGASSTGGNMGAEQSASAGTCAPCTTGGSVGDGDLDGVDDCIDECPSTPPDTCVDAVGCRVRDALFDFGATWNYDDTGTDVSGTFRTTPLSSSGPAQLGFGDGDETTTLTNQGTAAYYFNKEFTLGDPSTIGCLTLDLAYDDGYIVYVNDVEVGRSDNMDGVTDAFDSLAVFSAENWLDRGIVISPSVLAGGTNLIAVEIHQEHPSSSDITFDAKLDESSFCTPDLDGDGDSFPAGSDCDDTNGDVWAFPGEVRDLRFSDHVTLDWIAPVVLGGNSVFYDVLRSEDPADFTTGTCTESDDGLDTVAQDAEPIPSGVLRNYLVRAQNACGEGTLGTDSGNIERQGTSCP